MADAAAARSGGGRHRRAGPGGGAAGAALVASAAGLAGSAIATLRRAGTEVDPGRPTTSLVVAGPYRFSRNPIYVAFTLLGLGVAALANAAWVALAVLGALLVVRRGVVEREERYLDRRFGADYGRYRAQVRRWF